MSQITSAKTMPIGIVSQSGPRPNPLAAAANELARWHGDVSLAARLEARLATIVFARRDVTRAAELLERSLGAWRHVRWPHRTAAVPHGDGDERCRGPLRQQRNTAEKQPSDRSHCAHGHIVFTSKC